MTPPDFRARLHALISEHVNSATDCLEAADELLAEVIADAAVAIGQKHARVG